MRKRKFYFLIPKSEKDNGILYAPKGTDHYFGEPAVPVTDYENMVFQLKDGVYAPYMSSNICANFFNEELKDLVQSFLPEDNTAVEFLPVKVESEVYGNRIYYLVHFNIIYDVVDLMMSKRISIPGRAPSYSDITVPVLIYEKIKDLHIFNTKAYPYRFFLSGELCKAIKERGLATGMLLMERRSV